MILIHRYIYIIVVNNASLYISLYCYLTLHRSKFYTDIKKQQIQDETELDEELQKVRVRLH